MPNLGFVITGNTSSVLQKLWDTIKKKGTSNISQKGTTKSIKAVTLIIDDPLNESKNYPFWKKEEDDWYQDNFVRKETNKPPEEEVGTQTTRRVDYVDTPSLKFIFPYKYVWRSRYYDLGYGYVKGVVNALKSIKYQVSSIKKKEDLKNLIHNTYYLIHPEILLAVLAWKGVKLINFYLKNPQVLDQELLSNRVDILLKVIEELKHSPDSRRAITPSFIYPQIDHSGAAGGIPVYQNYQLYINFNKGRPNSLTSFHLHRAFDALRGLQLDINHDKGWGILASKKLSLPLKEMVILGNDVWLNEDHQKIDIRTWLLSATNSYDPKVEDIEKRLSQDLYQKKIEYALKKLKD